jgi:hypothetical protein
MKISDSETEIKGLLDMPLINEDTELATALILQNLQHPKNHHRREAIAAKTYMEILTPEAGQAFLSRLLSTNLRNELASRETQIRTELLSSQASQSAEVFLQAPDKYFAAAVLMQKSLLLGSGDRTTIIYAMKKSGGACKAIKDKLILLQKVKFLGFKMFKDDFTKVSPDAVNINTHEQYHIWLTLVRQKKVITQEEFVEAFPNTREKAEVWAEAIDETGFCDLGSPALQAYMKKKKLEKRLQQQKAANQ